MNKQNPFNITFGKEPLELIHRGEVIDKILTSFSYENPTEQLYMLIGPRGCGKTVLMTSVANHFQNDKNWIIVDLNPHDNMLDQLASSIYQRGKLKHLFLKKDFSFSFQGLSFSIVGENPVTNVFNLLDIMFEYLKKKGISVLITIDEVNNNQYMRVFAHSFQSFIRNNYSVFLLMTGLYENISSLENEKSLTFLYRSPKIYLEPLNLRAISYSYMEQLNLSEKQAIVAAKMTQGYAFAYQLLGYIMFEQQKKEIDSDVLKEFDLILDEKSYSKIWSELTQKEREIVTVIAYDKTTNQEIMDTLNIKSNSLAVYKGSLKKKGIINTQDRGVASFALPRFKEFVLFIVNL